MNRTQLMVSALRRHLNGGRVVIPAGGNMLWQWFLHLSATRSYHAAGPNPISYGEIDAYFRLYDIPRDRSYVETILAMDAAWQDEFFKKKATAPDGVAVMPQPLDEQMNGDLFDALWGE